MTKKILGICQETFSTVQAVQQLRQELAKSTGRIFVTKKAILTGSTGGLGSQIARILAEDGWDLVLLNRSKEQAEDQISNLRTSYPDQTFDGFQVDLSDIDNIKEVAKNVAASHSQINGLYNVAGLLTDKRIVSPQGIEGHFALNSIAPYLLTQSLRSQLGQGALPQSPAFVANFSSEVVNGMNTLAVDKLVNPDTIGGLRDAYAKTKAALNVMACFLKDELMEENIYIYSVDPGPTKTGMTSGNQGMPWFVRLLVPFMFGDPAIQAQKLIDGIRRELKRRRTGTFISNGKAKDNPPAALDRQIQDELRELMDVLIERA